MLIQNSNIGNVAQTPQPGLSGEVSSRGVSKPQLQSADPVPALQSATKSAPSPQPSAEQLARAVDAINQTLRQSNHSLEFTVDQDTRMSVVKLVDVETGELIRQIPSEETLAIARSIDRFQQGQQGLLLRQKA